MERFGVVIVTLLAFVAVVVASSIFLGWLLMLSIGILYGAGVVPATIGIWPDGLALGLLFGILFSSLVATSK
jgi:hypothetical protein